MSGKVDILKMKKIETNIPVSTEGNYEYSSLNKCMLKSEQNIGK